MKQKRFSFHLWVVCLLLLAACAPAATPSATTTTVPEEEPVATQTEESPTLTPEPTELSGPSFTNPIYKNDFPDPHLILVDDTYYAYSTNVYPSNIPAIKSTNLIDWESLGDTMPALPKWAVPNFEYAWAPGIIQIEDKFVMYFVARDKEIDKQCIGVGISDTPEGPFTDPNEEAFICQGDLGGSIDAYPFHNDDGKLYVLWKNDGNCCGLEVALWIQELSPDGLTLIGEPVKLIRRDQPWERPLIENPAMVKNGDGYYLFYSGNWWESHEYAIGYAICESVLGPCEKPLSEPWFKFKPPVMGPGGEAFFMDTKGNLWMAYHAWTGADVGYPLGQRSLRIDLVTFEDGKPVTNGPTYTPQLLP
ncbi:MAG TPA: glycoside hydrolase family 43 protein [Anaerolineales bacterium]|nr:glycoside hydrolase family 43 protein [Anaerolineales bacterium]